MPETETATKPTFQQAAAAATATLAAEDKAPETPAEGETKVEEPKPEEKPKAETPPKETADEPELLSKEEVAKLTPEQQANYKKMQKVYTQKTQKLAAERKKLEQWNDVIEAYEQDPKAVLRTLAKQNDLKLAEEAATEQKTSAVAAEKADGMQVKLRTLLGEENQALADGLAQIFREELQAASKQVVASELEPIKNRQQALEMEAVQKSTVADLEGLTSRHPDWKEYEPKMMEIANKWTPAANANMDTAEYLDTLYRLASLDADEATQTKKVIDRLNKSAKAAEPAKEAVNSQITTPARPKKPTIQEAYDAAKKGIVW
jgi:hypothetical protein